MMTPVEYEFYVQIGAFTSQDRADKFVKENQSKLNYNMDISFSNEVKLWVVRLPVFASREEAEKVRNDLWNSGDFDDAFIVTLEKNTN